MPPFDEVRDMLLWGVLPSLLAASLVFAAIVGLGGLKQAPAASALGLIVGVVLALWLRAAHPLVPTEEEPSPLLAAVRFALSLANGDASWNRLPWAILAALAVERLARVVDTHTNEGWLLRGAASVGIAWWVIPEPLREKFVWLAPAFAAVVFLEWVLLERLAAEPPDGGVLFCLALVFMTAGIVLLHAGIARWMELAVFCAMAFAGIGLVAWWRRADVSGAIPAAAILLPSLLLMGERGTAVKAIPWYAFALVALAPLTLVASWPLRNRPGVARYIVRVVLVLIPLVAAVVLTRIAAGPLDLGLDAEENW
jgi:hypothetical protein